MDFLLKVFIEEINKINYLVDDVDSQTELSRLEFDDMDVIETIMCTERNAQLAIPDEFVSVWLEDGMTVGKFVQLIKSRI